MLERMEQKMRIWYQSSTPLGHDPMWSPYEESIRRHVQKVAEPDTEVQVHGVMATHLLAERSSYAQYLNQAQIINNAINAEREGYDAFCVACTGDPGFSEIREVVGIPVVFLSQSCFHLASILANKFSLIAHNRNGLLELRQKIRQYGLEDRFVPCSAFNLTLLELVKGFSNPEPIVDVVKETAREAIENGAGILLCSCNILNMILVDYGLMEIDGIAILDTAGTIVKMAEFMVALRQAGICSSKTGLRTLLSREELASVMKSYGVQ